MPIIQRQLGPKLKQHLNAFPVVGLTGPRQSGKSTLLRHLLPGYTYITFDNPVNVELFQGDPMGFINNYSDKAIFDEVHYVPDIFRYLKIIVDNDRKSYGKFIVTSSNQFSFLNKASESLSGRIALLTLLPLQFTEVPPALHEECIFRGCYPELVDRAFQLSDSWYSAYLDTYLNKDIRELLTTSNIRDFHRLIKLLAANTSQILNMSTYANDLGVSVNTIKKWIALLEASYIIFLLPPYYTNFGKRIIKSPKVYFYDTGLVSFLTGIKNKELFENGPMTGSLFENYLIAEILKKIKHEVLDAELFYYRTSHGAEIDLIIDWKTHQDFIEIKNSQTFRPKMVANIENLIPNQNKGYLLYRGTNQPYSNDIKVINYQDYLCINHKSAY